MGQKDTGLAATVYASTCSSVWNELEGLVGLALVVLSKLCCFKITKWDTGALVFCVERCLCSALCPIQWLYMQRDNGALDRSTAEFFHSRHMLHMLKALYIMAAWCETKWQYLISILNIVVTVLLKYFTQILKHRRCQKNVSNLFLHLVVFKQELETLSQDQNKAQIVANKENLDYNWTFGYFIITICFCFSLC